MFVSYGICIWTVTPYTKPSLWNGFLVIYAILENIYLLFARFDENCNLQNVDFVKMM